MSLKSVMLRVPIIHFCRDRYVFGREYRYDKKFFMQNYSHSKENRDKIGYNMLLISHSLEKGMSNKSPRRFGVAKTEELVKMIENYARYEKYDKDFAFINAINVLRGYVKFYDSHKWQNTDEYKKVLNLLNNYRNVEKMDVGSYELHKKMFIDDSAIDYRKFLASRHSVREFLSKKVNKNDIERAVETAILSPSACNRQMCKIYFVTNNGKKQKLAKMAQGFGGFEKETINLVVITFDVNANYMIGERNQGWFNAGLFSMNFVNALHSQGIGSCFCQFGNSTSDEDTVRRILGAKDSERVAVMVAVGYYCDECLIPYSPRKRIEDVYRIV